MTVCRPEVAMLNLGKMLFEDGVAATLKGDYATAMRLWRPLADQGVASAQYTPVRD